MKQYSLLIIVLLVCALAVTGAVVIRMNEKKKIDGNLEEYIESVEDNIAEKNEDVNVYNDNSLTSKSTQTVESTPKILVKSELQTLAGNNKKYVDVVLLFTKYRANSASLTTEKTLEDVTIEYSVALDMSKSSMKLSQPDKEFNRVIADYLNTNNTYNITMTEVDDNIMKFVVKNTPSQ